MYSRVMIYSLISKIFPYTAPTYYARLRNKKAISKKARGKIAIVKERPNAEHNMNVTKQRQKNNKLSKIAKDKMAIRLNSSG